MWKLEWGGEREEDWRRGRRKRREMYIDRLVIGELVIEIGR